MSEVMEIKEGFKESSLGLIPKEWEVVKQEEVATFYNGRAYKRTEWEESGIPVIRLQNLTGSGQEYYYSNLELPDHQYCYNGDLLYMWSASFGTVWWKGDKAIFHYHIWKIDTNENRLHKPFLYFLLDEVTVRMKRESHGSTMLHVTKGGMEKLPIPLPPLPEQKKIAEILTTVDDKIEVIEERIRQTQELKKGLMQRLLTKGIGHNKFKDSPLGEIPESWEVMRLEDVAKCFVGIASSATHAYDSEGVLLLRNQNIKEGYLDMKDVLYVKPEYEIQHKTKRLKVGDILTMRTGYPGVSAVVPQELENCQSFTTLITRITSKNLSSSFLCYYINSEIGKSFFLGKQAGGAQKNVGTTSLKTMEVPIPSDQEQLNITNILTSVDDKIEVLQEKKSTYQNLKKGLMQQLLTGKKRVKI
jgi:type I restriction enzyme S subunit